MIIADSSEPPPAQRTPVNVQSVGPLMAVLPTGNQFAQTGNQLQSNAVGSQNTYIGGRLTPQAMQQGTNTTLTFIMC